MAAEAAVSLAVETLGHLLIEKAVFLKDVKGDVEWVRDELKRMQCFLKDAAKKQSDSESIRNWISEIREVAHDAEDVIHKFVLNIESRGLLQRYACFPVHVYHLNNIGNEIESIRKRLKDIESSRLSYGIQNLGESSRSRSQLEVESRRRLAYWKPDSDVVGLEKDVQLLLDRAILEKRGGLSMASIIGMGGIGKSTLANKIYNHPKIAGEFECRAWVVVSSEFTADDITKQILEQLGIPVNGILESVDDELRRQQRLQEDMDGLAALHHITTLKLEDFRFLETLTNFPPKLSYLTLSEMESIEDLMPVLETLPELLYLKMDRVHLGEEIVITRHGFPKLKVLHLKGMRLISIQVEKGGMPELKQLFIHRCDDFNIENLPEHLKSAITNA